MKEKGEVGQQRDIQCYVSLVRNEILDTLSFKTGKKEMMLNATICRFI